MSPSIIHVLAVDDAKREQVPSLMTVATPSGAFTVKAAKGHVTLDAGKASASVDLKTGLVTFFNAAGKPVLNETLASIAPVTVEGKAYVATQARFNPGTTEAFYGLGQHQNAQMDLNGEDVLLSQHNMDVAVPFVMSNQNYGVLWDNDRISPAAVSVSPRLPGDPKARQGLAHDPSGDGGDEEPDQPLRGQRQQRH